MKGRDKEGSIILFDSKLFGGHNMMDESEVLSLISQSESPKLDFKREINLDTARGKAELVKDIIANANSGFQVAECVNDLRHEN